MSYDNIMNKIFVLESKNKVVLTAIQQLQEVEGGPKFDNVREVLYGLEYCMNENVETLQVLYNDVDVLKAVSEGRIKE